jgi:pimeloyl-ACP methyl ester carboxylesterase
MGLPETRYARSGELNIAYQVLGEGPSVLLIHGGGADGDMWPAAEIDSLARDHRVITYNRRGYPGSGEPVRDWVRHREDAAALLGELEATPATVVGFSAGGIVALDLAVHGPELVSSLVLIDPAVYGRRYLTPDLARMFVSAQLARRFRGAERGAEIFGRWATSYSTGGSAWDREDYPEERRDAIRANARALFADLASGDGSHIPREGVRAIGCPVTLAVTELSPRWLQRVARGLRKSLPDSHRFEMIRDSGHALAFDRPGELERVVRQGSLSRARS